MADITPVLSPADALQLARDAAKAMWSRDHAAQALGMAIAEVKPGTARLTMRVRQDMVNGHAICHGGMLFTLADTAFAYACNSYNRNTVASACNIDFLAPAHLGDTLVAEAVERSQSGRTGVYDVTVSTAAGKTVALFRGKSYRIQGEVMASFAQV
jgi:acyl-CoA thioesterase